MDKKAMELNPGVYGFLEAKEKQLKKMKEMIAMKEEEMMTGKISKTKSGYTAAAFKKTYMAMNEKEKEIDALKETMKGMDKKAMELNPGVYGFLEAKEKQLKKMKEMIAMKEEEMMTGKISKTKS